MPRKSFAADTPRPMPVRAAARSLPVSAADFLPNDQSLHALREAAKRCRGCDLWKHATQTVFGEGREGATIMFVGEQPGDKEDRVGRPFVGPAGAFLDKCLQAAGIDRDDVYVTNVVKHFKWTPRGKLRIHKKPSVKEIAACRPWLDAELRAVRPRVVACLGASAAQALLGRDFKVTQRRGEFIEKDRILYTATVHPSSILRSTDDESRRRKTELFIRDLKKILAAVAHKRAA